MSGPGSRCSRGCASSVPEWSWDCAGASGWVLRRLTEFNAGRACHGMPLWGSSARDDHCRASGLGARCCPVRTVRPHQPARSSTDCNGHGARVAAHQGQVRVQSPPQRPRRPAGKHSDGCTLPAHSRRTGRMERPQPASRPYAGNFRNAQLCRSAQASKTVLYPCLGVQRLGWEH